MPLIDFVVFSQVFVHPDWDEPCFSVMHFFIKIVWQQRSGINIFHDTFFFFIIQTLDARQQEYDDSMMSDSTINYIGSGDNRQLNIGGGIRLESDDEDLNVSGSGSGDGSGLAETGVNVKIAPRRFSFYII